MKLEWGDVLVAVAALALVAAPVAAKCRVKAETADLEIESVSIDGQPVLDLADYEVVEARLTARGDSLHLRLHDPQTERYASDSYDPSPTDF